PAPPMSYTLSLHDALPISPALTGAFRWRRRPAGNGDPDPPNTTTETPTTPAPRITASPHHLTGADRIRARPPVTATTITGVAVTDRKSTRLNSSHDQISYA